MEKYVKLSDVLSAIKNYDVYQWSINDMLNSIPTINDPEFILKTMIQDANNSMYPEKWQLDMKEFNMFSCWKASLEIALDKLTI